MADCRNWRPLLSCLPVPTMVCLCNCGDCAGVGCGNRQLAVTAAAAYKSPVYYGVNYHNPSSPFLGMPFPFHMWDYIAATRTWNIFALPYTPSADDIAYGDIIRSAWLSLAFNGTAGPGTYIGTAGSEVWGAVSCVRTARALTCACAYRRWPGWRAVNDVAAGHTLNAAVLTTAINNTLDFKVALCSSLNAAGLDSRFWWIN